MDQVVVGIGGAHSGAGKTTVGCGIIRSLAAEGISAAAIKCEPDELYTSITDDPDVINQQGKDTALMREAGASEVLWVRAPRGEMQEALDIAMDRLPARGCVIVEGNSAIEVLAGRNRGDNPEGAPARPEDAGGAIELLKPLIVLFITGVHGAAPLEKESARRVLAMSHILIHGGRVPPEAPVDMKKYSREESGAYIAHVLSLIKGARECPQKQKKR
jgi:molybdopterin-guanine dinucleotide biosynthesis protein